MSRGKVSPSALFQQIAKGNTTEFEDVTIDESDDEEINTTVNMETNSIIKGNKSPKNAGNKLPDKENGTKVKESKKAISREKVTIYFEDDELEEFAKVFSEIHLELRLRTKYKLIEYKFLKLAAKMSFEEFKKDKEKFITKILKAITE